jgi:peptidoglycan/LPS O-acetylase OafA/YrhL
MSAVRPRAGLHLPSLDGIRAVSFLLVFAAHAGLERVVPGGFGVTVFFFLSGYLITTLLRIEHDTYGGVSIRRFYLRRALRILPPFYLVLGLSALAAALGVLAGGVSARALFAQTVHLANYWIVREGYAGQPAGTGVYWSLAVEEHFYLFFPCLFLLLRRFVGSPRRQAAALWALCATLLAWRCVLVLGLHASVDRTYLATDTRADSILFGCALALHGNPALDGPSRVSEAGWKWILLPASCLCLLLTFVHRAPAFRETLRYSLQGVALVPIFVVALRWPSWGPCRVLNLRVMSFLGELSYSLYLVHHVLLGALRALPGVARAPLALALAIGIAWAIHELVEKPCARLRRRLAGEGEREPASTEIALLPARGR